MRREIFLFDSDEAEILEGPGYIIAVPKLKGPVAAVEVNKKPFNPGQLRVSRAALELLGDKRVCELFIAHLLAQFEGLDPDSFRENQIALHTGAPLYNFPEEGVMILTLQADNTTLCLREEY